MTLAAFAVVVALLAVAIWTVVAFRVAPLVRGDRSLHLTTIYLTVGWSVGFDLLLILATAFATAEVTIPGPIIMGAFGFVMGMQLVAALSAHLFVRSLRK